MITLLKVACEDVTCYPQDNSKHVHICTMQSTHKFTLTHVRLVLNLQQILYRTIFGTPPLLHNNLVYVSTCMLLTYCTPILLLLQSKHASQCACFENMCVSI